VLYVARLLQRPVPCNCNVVITGASAGIGRAVALRFARAGARLGLIARAADALLDLKEEAERLGARAVIAPTDVADAGAVLAAAVDDGRGAVRGLDFRFEDEGAVAVAPAHARLRVGRAYEPAAFVARAEQGGEASRTGSAASTASRQSRRA
jgi:NAD(P)-dependent dehydrogenase (short-subunit alcohol dehydrogenase family)